MEAAVNSVTEVALADIKVGERTRTEMGDIPGLAASIEARGLLQPILVTTDLELIVGARRLDAFAHLGRPTIPACIVGTQVQALEKLLAEQHENTCRKGFTPQEAVIMARRVEALEKPRARERHAEGVSAGGKKAGKGRPVDSSGTNGTRAKRDNTKRSATVGATAAGMSATTYGRAKKLVEAAEADPRHQDLVEQMNRTGQVTPAFDKLLRRLGHKTTRAPNEPRLVKRLSVDTASMKKIKTAAKEAKRLVNCHASQISIIHLRKTLGELFDTLNSYLKLGI